MGSITSDYELCIMFLIDGPDVGLYILGIFLWFWQ